MKMELGFVKKEEGDCQETKVYDDDYDFLTPGVRRICKQLLPHPEILKAYEATDGYT